MGLAVVWRTDVVGGEDLAADWACPVNHAPTVVSVEPAQLADLKQDLKQVIATYVSLVPGDRGLIPYEQGVVTAYVAWSDTEPGNAGIPPSGPRPGGYEMRWWTATRDNVVTDAFLFADASQAEAYLEFATHTGCRPSASRQPADLPPEGRYLEWSNPLSYAQQDVFLQRGRRVYRVAVVQPGVGSTVSGSTRARGFRLVGRLACGLPDAGCTAEHLSGLV
ncbi:MAG: hypothetical protein M3Y75_12950 [Actinomycetota bacterium]|nr:hypothetical protein [Actinomycetota bacterium]